MLAIATPSTHSGVTGKVVMWPTCPVERIGHPCEKPVKATIDVMSTDGRLISKAATDASGKFRIALAPGSYLLKPEPLRPNAPMPRPVARTVLVLTGVFTQVRLWYDTGMR